MLEHAVEEVGDGLEAAVRMPRRALRLAGRVLDLAHLVEVDERVEVLEQDAGKRTADGEALALEAARRGRQLADLPLTRDDGVGRGDPGEDGDVVDADRGHWRDPDVVG